MARKVTYRDAGVDIDAGDAFVEELKRINPAIGGFGGFVPIPKGYEEPVMVLSTDGVGTKLLIAKELRVFDTIGIDLVAMVVNDIVTSGARPLAFLDYYAMDKLRVAESAEIMKGIVAGCAQAGCQLTGGETAELPGIYPKGGFDLAGFAIGVVEKAHAIDGSKVKAGDVVIGLPSSGIHSNGYSLARRVLLDGKKKPRGARRREVLEMMIRPTSIYVKPMLKLLRKVDVHGIAHITGGGLPGNLVRVIPKKLRAVLDPAKWDVPEVFKLIEDQGPVAAAEMYRVFNMGIGMCIVVDRRDAKETLTILRRNSVHALEIGHIEKGPPGVVIEGVSE